MLYDYQQRTQLLLADLKQEIVNSGMLTLYINQARGQLAGDAECIRNRMTRVLVAPNSGPYPFTSFLVSAGAVGIAGALNVRQVTVPVTGGIKMLNAWPWEYFNQFFVSTQTPTADIPNDWAQLGQGAGGTIFLSPPPSTNLTMTLDCVCYPVGLVDDLTAEAIPYPWTDAVPYFAAYLAYLGAQQTEQAKGMFGLYEEFKTRARKYATPAVLPQNYEQSSPQAPVIPLNVGAKRA